MVLDRKLLDKENLEFDEISRHQKRLCSPNSNLHFKILKTMSLSNKGIVDTSVLKLEPSNMKFAAFIPSAGAASRYYASIKDLLVAIENSDLARLEVELEKVNVDEFSNYAVPETTKKLILNKDIKAIMAERDVILSEIAAPKALQPAFKSGMTFIDVKKKEHQALEAVSAEFFIINPKSKSLFSSYNNKEDSSFLLEQGPKLSTIRFNTDGSPYVDAHGNYTVVPAGHGSLTKLIPEVKKHAPQCESIFIRNIDNINGVSSAVLEETNRFLNFHAYIMKTVKNIRSLLATSNIDEADQVACDMIDFLSLEKAKASTNSSLWTVLKSLFHLQDNLAEKLTKELGSELEALRYFFERPVNTVGQVPNSGMDVGATAVLCEDDKKREFVIALEPPHASPEDKANIFLNPEVATHFNPAFVASEIVDDTSVYQNENYDLWIKAEKQFKGTPVMYHESVLYELLGNSIMSNVCFPEISRILFHPHKSVKDTTLHSKGNFFESE